MINSITKVNFVAITVPSNLIYDVEMLSMDVSMARGDSMEMECPENSIQTRTTDANYRHAAEDLRWLYGRMLHVCLKKYSSSLVKVSASALP